MARDFRWILLNFVDCRFLCFAGTKFLGFKFCLVFDVGKLYRATRDVILSCLFYLKLSGLGETRSQLSFFFLLWQEMVSSVVIKFTQIRLERLFVMLQL